MSFFRSRWVRPPVGTTEIGPRLPPGFRAAGVACGIKDAGALDLGLLVSDPSATTSAARFTRSGLPSAPVRLTRQHSRLEALRGIVVNSGNANAATGSEGLERADAMRREAAATLGLAPEQVAVASTGVIGVPLPSAAISDGIAAAADALHHQGDAAFAEAIRTTDACAKRAAVEVALSRGSATLSAQAKGAGMISPGFATLLAFVQTDAALAPERCSRLLAAAVERSFERITVDGQLSTSDTVILQCNGASGIRLEPESEDELRLGAALTTLLRQLALEIVRDGEGTRRVGRLVVRGGEEATVRAVARAVADSPLVKTALYGGDPNWGRIAQAAGMATAGSSPVPLDIVIEGVAVCTGGACTPHDGEALRAAVQRTEVEYEVSLPGEGAEAEVFFSDLGHEYVTLNAEYTT